jgi:hypothetical protein
METQVLSRIEDVFSEVDSPSIYATYNLNCSSIKGEEDSETLTIIRVLDNPASNVNYSFSIDMGVLIEELKKIKNECANINAVLAVFAYHPSMMIRDYFAKTNLAAFAKKLVAQWDAMKFGL